MTESHHSTAAEELDLPIPDWEVEDDALWQIRLASDDAFRLALSRHFGHQLIRGKVILAARDKDLTTLSRLTTTHPEITPLALRARMVVLAAQRGDFAAVDRLTAKYPELTQLVFDALPRDLGEIGHAQHVTKVGKQKQRFTKSEVERAQSAPRSDDHHSQGWRPRTGAVRRPGGRR